MPRPLVTGIVIVLVVGAAAGAGLLALGGPGAVVDGGDAPDGTDGTEAGSTDGGDSTTTTATPQMADTEAAFVFAIDDIQECGDTCRDVTATLSNDGGEAAANVTVETNVYTDGDLIWEGDEDVGRLDAGGEHTSTKRVELGYSDALKVENNDGWITIETIVRFEDGQQVFTEERQVS